MSVLVSANPAQRQEREQTILSVRQTVPVIVSHSQGTVQLVRLSSVFSLSLSLVEKPIKSRSTMPGKRSSEAKRKAKSASRAARHREMLGIPEWENVNEAANPDAHHQDDEKDDSEPEEMEVQELLQAIDELLDDESPYSSLEMGTMAQAASVEGHGGPSLVDYTSVISDTFEMYEMDEPLDQGNTEEEDVLQISVSGEDLCYEAEKTE